MHDPMTVAFDIVRPWPERSKAVRRGRRWSFGYRRGKTGPFVLSRFWTLAGREWYWPALVTIWHHDPGGYDSGDKCPWDSHWQWHIHHWRIQLHPVQHARRWLLTRCEWCGGKSRKGSRVNHGKGWESTPSRWWQGERGGYHADCLTAETMWNTCTCEVPNLGRWPNNKSANELPREYGECHTCRRFRAWKQKPEVTARAERWRSLVPKNTRPSPEALRTLRDGQGRP